jgi:hypothetical protein
VVRAHPTVPEQKISKHSHEVTDEAALLVRPRYKGRYKWRVRMTALTRNKSGDFVARKVIPRMYGKPSRSFMKARLTLPAHLGNSKPIVRWPPRMLQKTPELKEHTHDAL